MEDGNSVCRRGELDDVVTSGLSEGTRTLENDPILRAQGFISNTCVGIVLKPGRTLGGERVVNPFRVDFGCIKLNLSKPIAFVTHGWTDDANKLWVQDIAQKVIRHLDRNVCVVQWKQLSAYKYEQAATENTLIVSDYLTKFIRFLVQNGLELKDMILIGHSLGAHVMGQTGYNFNGEIGQIYGLDPARAFFTVPEDRGLQYRLDSTDAKYVQMIITTRGLGGVLFGDGHDNFYPNGGTNPQPHCTFPLLTDAEFANQLLCSHIHSTTLFRLSLSPWTLYLGNRCDSYPRYLLGMCKDHKPNNLGIFNNRAGGDFYLRTTPKSPLIAHMNQLGSLHHGY
ncbi:lipase [Culex quinquefasciatus]|uniref:Lipase n=1 Tax=Culex quinquefasciatus TaxID=7176 RepID=B0WHY1_CULQU|nr:lipase [Culex quinquefasciatus]|eukprot:XP_001848315.1 lipase [Culex quinquefasciatus]